MSYWRKKSRLKLLGTALVLALLSLSLASAQQPLPTASWGLSFQQEGKPPVGNASPQALDRCDAKFLGDTSEQVIYLTFDAGFEAGYTPKLLDILKAGFAVRPARHQPGESVGKRILLLSCRG